jgi:hypothetical protein
MRKGKGPFLQGFATVIWGLSVGLETAFFLNIQK